MQEVRAREKEIWGTKRLALKMEKGDKSKGMQADSEGRNGEEADAPLEFLEGMNPCCHIDFSPVRFLS